MRTERDPRDVLVLAEPEADATDGGWDPYIATLLNADAPHGASTGEEDDDTPVMTLSRKRSGDRRSGSRSD